MESSKAFRSFPTTVASCVTLADDTNEEIGCKQCTAHSLTKNIVEFNDNPVVDQINMVQGFLPATGKVISFFVPFYNEDSGSEKSILFSYGREYTEEGVSKTPDVLDDAGKPMEMDVVEAKYFKFLKKP